MDRPLAPPQVDPEPDDHVSPLWYYLLKKYFVAIEQTKFFFLWENNCATSATDVQTRTEHEKLRARPDPVESDEEI